MPDRLAYRVSLVASRVDDSCCMYIARCVFVFASPRCVGAVLIFDFSPFEYVHACRQMQQHATILDYRIFETIPTSSLFSHHENLMFPPCTHEGLLSCVFTRTKGFSPETVSCLSFCQLISAGAFPPAGASRHLSWILDPGSWVAKPHRQISNQICSAGARRNAYTAVSTATPAFLGLRLDVAPRSPRKCCATRRWKDRSTKFYMCERARRSSHLPAYAPLSPLRLHRSFPAPLL